MDSGIARTVSSGGTHIVEGQSVKSTFRGHREVTGEMLDGVSTATGMPASTDEADVGPMIEVETGIAGVDALGERAWSSS